MSDLVARLRSGAKMFQFSGNEEEELAQAAIEAADTIERLERERDEAHATMKRWQSCGGCVGTFCKADALLERALEGERSAFNAAVARDEALALLREARKYVELFQNHPERPTTKQELLARIDALLAKVVPHETATPPETPRQS